MHKSVASTTPPQTQGKAGEGQANAQSYDLLNAPAVPEKYHVI